MTALHTLPYAPDPRYWLASVPTMRRDPITRRGIQTTAWCAYRAGHRVGEVQQRSTRELAAAELAEYLLTRNDPLPDYAPRADYVMSD